MYSIFREFLLKILIVLHIFLGKRALDPPLHLAVVGFNKQMEEVFAVLKLIFSTQRKKLSAIDFLFQMYCYIHTALLDNQKLKQCPEIIKSGVEI